MHYLYRITNLINNKIYIGQSINPNSRWLGHKNQAKRDVPNQIISKSIKKYGINNFLFEVIATCSSYEDANYIEEELIKQYNCLARDGYGYNLSLGGESAPKSEEFKKKVSQTLMGHPVSEETLRKLSESHMGQVAWNKGIPWPKDIAEKISQLRKGQEPWNKGIPRSEELKVKQRKLSPEQELSIVKDIRSSRVIAKEYGVNKSTILDICKRNKG